jgi:hypothetical protein
MSSRKVLVPSDLICSRNSSGYKYVVPCGGGLGWQASRNGGGRPDGWRGPMRPTELQAAQDYCDYENGLPLAQHPSRRLKSAGHARLSTPRVERDAEVEAALGVLRDHRAQRRGEQGYVYLITDAEYFKIGYSVNPPKRVAELQTGNARVLSLLGQFPGTPDDERATHDRFRKCNVLQEWFRLDACIVTYFDRKIKEATESA